MGVDEHSRQPRRTLNDHSACQHMIPAVCAPIKFHMLVVANGHGEHVMRMHSPTWNTNSGRLVPSRVPVHGLEARSPLAPSPPCWHTTNELLYLLHWSQAGGQHALAPRRCHWCTPVPQQPGGKPPEPADPPSPFLTTGGLAHLLHGSQARAGTKQVPPVHPSPAATQPPASVTVAALPWNRDETKSN